MRHLRGIIVIIRLLGLGLIIFSILCVSALGQTTSWDWMIKGSDLHSQGKFDEAIQAYDKALELDPNNTGALNLKGLDLVKLGKHDEAIAAYDKAIELDPNNESIYRINKDYVLTAKELENLGNIEPNEFNSSLNYSYELIDQYILEKKPPASFKKSVKKLAPFLIAPATNDREKARAIYRWIAENINYDVESYLSDIHVNDSPIYVLKERKAVCAGYAKLFKALAKEANLTVVYISGDSKGYKYTTEGKTSSHGWNAIKINSSWYLLDPTWGAGYIDENVFHRRFNDYYFLTPPSQFVYKHFPDDPKWQLLNNPLSKDEFERLILLEPGFFTYGVRLGNQNNNTIISDGESNITLFAPMDVLLRVELNEMNEDSDNLTYSHTFIKRDNERYDILVKAPHPGNYTLSIFAKRAEDQMGAEVMKYRLEASSASKEGNSFPIVYPKFTEAKCYLYEPMVGKLNSDEPQTFKIKVPGALSVSIFNGKDWTDLTKNGDVFEGEVSPVKGGKGIVEVAANFGNTEASIESLLRYTII
ncbi:MAG: tetratricopeptide repeat protein [Methanotrichaceae archaeon]|nr:tetratricopeptide repeat protein [Methanotrichaceae archaeon]